MARSRSPWTALLLSTLLVACAARGASSVGTASPASRPGGVRLELTDQATGRVIFSSILEEGERAALAWTNSLFQLQVTEVFVVREGRLALTSVTYADPGGKEPPRVRPEDAADLVQTGGPFHAEGIARPIRTVTFRVGEVGKPTFRAAGKTIRFLDEVGFGGSIRLEATPDSGSPPSIPAG